MFRRDEHLVVRSEVLINKGACLANYLKLNPQVC